MIKSFKHKGLKKLFEADDHSGIRTDLVPKSRRILARLDNAGEISDVDLPGYGLHSLKGGMKGYWAVTVNGNWRIIFRFDGDAHDVELVDYH